MTKNKNIFLLISFLLFLTHSVFGQNSTESLSEIEVNVQTMGNPEAASRTHLQAIMQENSEIAAQTMAFPFIHVGEDGSKVPTMSPENVRTAVGFRDFRSEMVSVTELENTGTVAVVRVVFQRYDLQGNATVQGSAIWGLVKEDSLWKVSWRQFLGVEN